MFCPVIPFSELYDWIILVWSFLSVDVIAQGQLTNLFYHQCSLCQEWKLLGFEVGFVKRNLVPFLQTICFPFLLFFYVFTPFVPLTKDTELSDNAYLKSWVFSTLLAISILHINIGLTLQMIASSQFYNIYIIGNFAFQLFTFCLHLLSWIGKKIWMTQHISKLEYCLPFMRSYSYTAHSIIV